MGSPNGQSCPSEARGRAAATVEAEDIGCHEWVVEASYLQQVSSISTLTLI